MRKTKKCATDAKKVQKMSQHEPTWRPKTKKKSIPDGMANPHSLLRKERNPSVIFRKPIQISLTNLNHYCFLYKKLVRSLFLRFVSAGVSAGFLRGFLRSLFLRFLRGFCGVSAEGPNHVPKVVLQRFVSATKFEVTKFLYKKQ